jgi:glucosamine--fructose-6-phosphate aminotransferase (isomerizing)
MCGIVGYTGARGAQPILLKGLKRLQYRGYDSCGIALLDKNISVFKDTGTVDRLESMLRENTGHTGIGHTRWATHGRVSPENAHPHLDCAGKIAVVHNGIIENYADLRARLTAGGHVFRSETDTEVISHLVEQYYQGDLASALYRAVQDLRGSWALVAMHEDSPQLVASRRDCPLILGLGDRTGNFIGSDVLAFLEYTDRSIYLEDGDFAEIGDSSVSITHAGKQVSRPEQRVEWNIEEAQKAGYPHFMLKEIHEQPRVIDQILQGRLSTLESEFNLGLSKFTNLEDVVLLACGSSFHAAMIGEIVLRKLARITTRAVFASEFDDPDLLPPWTGVIAISQSGETADTLKALKKAKQAGGASLAITNVPGSTITRYADEVLYTYAGPEVAVAATKTFTTQLLALILLSISSKILDSLARDRLSHELRNLSGKIQRILDNQEEIQQSAAQLATYNSLFLIARGINYPAAMEGALKIKEVAYIHAEAFPAGELKHGPFALLGPECPVIAIVSTDEVRDQMLTSIKEIKARRAPVIAIAPENDPDIDQYVDRVIHVPGCDPVLSPLVNVIPLQLLAYYLARQRGCPIDLPANLAKSVTVN